MPAKRTSSSAAAAPAAAAPAAKKAKSSAAVDVGALVAEVAAAGAKKGIAIDASALEQLAKGAVEAFGGAKGAAAPAKKAAKKTAAAAAPKGKAAPKAKAAPAAAAAAASSSSSSSSSSAAAAGVSIVSSKACQAFAKRADGLKAAVAAARPGAKIVIDEQKKEGSNPDRGSFVVVAGGKTIVELRGMARPFTAMKALDMEDVAAKVIAAL